jgi:hypothetical protein
MKLTLGQAAKECGKSKATLSKAIKSGRLSVLGKTSAGYEIDPAELFRVFPKEEFATNETNNRKPPNKAEHLTNLAIRLGIAENQEQALKREIEMLREMIAQSAKKAEEYREMANSWQKQAETLLLVDQRSKQGGGLFGWLKKAG